MASKLITTAEAADNAGISRRYLQRLCIDGRVKGAQKLGRDWFVPSSFKWKPLPRGPKPKVAR
jgi:hypothetical protein